MKSKIIFEDHEERKIIRRRIKNEEIIKLLAERDEYRKALLEAKKVIDNCSPQPDGVLSLIRATLAKYPQQ